MLNNSNSDRNSALPRIESLADGPDLGRLLEQHRGYLLIIARTQLNLKLQSKVDASDVVQEVCLVAHQQVHTFRGSQVTDFRAWLRGIMANLIAQQYRRFYGTKGRNVRLEQTLHDELEHTSACIERGLFADTETPSRIVAGQESMNLLAEAIEALPDDYRTIILMRNIEGLSFPEIARRLERTVDSVEKLWMRGLGKLRTKMKESSKSE